MEKKLMILAPEVNLKQTDDELRKRGMSTVMIGYTYANYDRDCEHILHLMDEVKKDYPEISNNQMKIMQLGPECKHYYRLCICIEIQLDDFISRRKKEDFKIF